MANPNFSCVLDAWRSGTTLYGRMHYWRSGSYRYQDTAFPDPTIDLGGGVVYFDSTIGNAVRNGVYMGDLYGATFSRTVSGTGSRTITYTAGSGYRSDFAGSWSATVGGFPGTSSPPTGLSCSNIVRGQNSFTATVSLGSWGVNNTGSGSRYRELQCWSLGMVEPRRYQVQYGDSLSSTITVGNNSSGSLTIMPNTAYRLGVYASNGAQNTGSQSVGDYTTLPPTPSISNTDVTATSATFSYDIPNQGGRYTMTLKKQLDGGALETVTTLSGSGQKTGTFTVTGLLPGETHTLSVTISTDAGSVSSDTITFITATPTATIYGSVSGDTKLVKKIYGPLRIIDTVDTSFETGNIFDSISDDTKLIMYMNNLFGYNGKITQGYVVTGVSVSKDQSGYILQVDATDPSLQPYSQVVASGLTYSDLTDILVSLDIFVKSEPSVGNESDKIIFSNTVYRAVTKEIKKIYGSINNASKLIYSS